MKTFVFALALCALQYVFGENAHKVFHEDHHVDGHHNPEHDMNAFLGTEVISSVFRHSGTQVSLAYLCELINIWPFLISGQRRDKKVESFGAKEKTCGNHKED